MATAMDPFSMFMLTTGVAMLKDDTSIINAVVKNSYLLPRFMEGKATDLLLQGGQKIQDILYLEEDSDAEFYKSDQQDFNYRNQQVGTAYELNWRFLANKTSWTDHEVGLNESGGLTDRIGRFHRFKRIQRLKFMNLWTTQIHKMEDALVATPDREEMEEGNGMLPYSLGVTINESADGLPVQGPSTTAWSQVQTIGTDKSKWNNQRSTYAGGTVDAEDFWGGMRELHTKCRFERLPKYGAFSDPTRSPSFYACSLWGLILAERSLREPQDLMLAGRQDASYPAPMFHGVPFVYIQNLNTATMWNPTSGTLLNDEGGTAHTGADNAANFTEGPRIMAIQGQCVNLIMHRERVVHRVPPFSPDRQPFKKVMVTDTWYNLVNQNRRESGVLSPSSAVSVPAQPSAGV